MQVGTLWSTHTRSGTEVVHATWDTDAQHYIVLLEDMTSKSCHSLNQGRTQHHRVIQQPQIAEDLLQLDVPRCQVALGGLAP